MASDEFLEGERGAPDSVAEGTTGHDRRRKKKWISCRGQQASNEVDPRVFSAGTARAVFSHHGPVAQTDRAAVSFSGCKAQIGPLTEVLVAQGPACVRALIGRARPGARSSRRDARVTN